MRSNILLIAFSVLMLIGCTPVASAQESLYQRVDTGALELKSHPRLFMTDAEFTVLRSKVNDPENTVIGTLHNHIIRTADESLKKSHLKYKLDVSGRRLLSVSRNALLRITSCAYAYRMTGVWDYLEYAEGELNAVCAFKDWNESHFLDVGEMALAVSAGYDWLYNDLSESTRQAVEQALKEKAFRHALKSEPEQRFYKATNNWNQVCNGGLVAAAIAVCDKYPSEAKQLIVKAIESNSEPVAAMYSPDGNYVEGYSYWRYGTSFQVLMLKMLEQSFGSDFSLSNIPGFMKTGDFMLFMDGACGCFNYSDCVDGTRPAVPMWYFADKLGRPELLYTEIASVESGMYADFQESRILPLAMCFMLNVDLTDVVRPSRHFWSGKGSNPMALVRGDWTCSESDAYLAVKGGKASNSHGHMDAGSFVYDAYGVRWVEDLGKVNYGPIEKAFKETGGNLWSLVQDSQRWTVQRYNNLHHSTITLNDQWHNVDGEAFVKEFINTDAQKGVTLDMTAVFEGQADKVVRTVKMLSDNSLLTDDQVFAPLGKPVKYSWRMVTRAVPQITDGGIVLEREGKTITLKAQSDKKFTYTTWSADPIESYDEPNPGYIIVGIESEIPAGKSGEFVVTLSQTR